MTNVWTVEMGDDECMDVGYRKFLTVWKVEIER